MIIKLNLVNAATILFILLFLLFGASVYYIYKTDNLIYRAMEDRPLDGRHKYVIELNEALVSKNANQAIIPEGVVYMIRVPREYPKHQIVIGGKVIGKTDINLEQYIGKYVYITGEYYWGRRLYLSENIPEIYKNDNTIVAHIKSIDIAH